jgi:predicted permease
MLHDLRYAFRALISSPSFTIAAVASLAIGIGINTTIFTLVNAVLLRPLPVAEPQQLVDLYTTSDVDHSTTSWLDYKDLRDTNSVFTGLVGYSLMFANISRDGRSRIAMGEVVTANYFDVLGVRLALGRGFDPTEEALEGGNRVVVLGSGFWRREFAGDPSAVGRTIRLRGVDYTIAGIAPSGFGGMTPGVSADLWIPSSMVDDVEPVGIQDSVPSPTGKTRLQRRGQRWMFLKGRLKSGVTASQAQTDVSRIMTRLEEEHPTTNKGRRGLVVPAGRVRIHPLIDGTLMSAGALLMIGVSLVLVIACANIANMLLARATTRTREIAIRLAIGAGRGRIVRQLLTESAVLAVLGGGAGLLLARWATRMLAAYQPPLPVALPLDLQADWRVLAFALCVSLVTGALFGLAPAIQATSPDLVSALKADVVGTQSRRRFPLRSALVIAEVAVCFVLLAGTGLLLRSLAAARTADVGFDPRGLVVTTVDLAMHRYSSDQGREFYRHALARLQSLPGVTSAALVERLPFSPNLHAQNIFIDGRTYAAGDRGATTDVTRVTAGYFKAIGVALLQGRDFDDRDRVDSPGVAIVNNTMARRYWPGDNAIGKRFRVRAADGPVFEVIGVSADHKVRTVGESPRPFVHFSRNQAYNPSATLIVRTAGNAEALVQAVRQELTGLEPSLVFLENQTMESSIATTLFPARIGALVLSVAGCVALLLAAIGLYGLIAFSVSRRTREIGIRVALGANPGSVLALVLRQGMALVLVGLVAGALIALVATRALQGALYGIGPTDPVSFGGALVLLTVVALAANLIPAYRASRTDPMVALRNGVRS